MQKYRNTEIQKYRNTENYKLKKYVEMIKMQQKVFYSIDLFSGPGGICTGFKWANIKPLIAVEISDWTVETYRISHNADVLNLEQYLKNPIMYESLFDYNPEMKTLLIHGDITKVTDDLILDILSRRFQLCTVDIVTGGAPCESFSLAGKRSEEDDRNTLFLNVIRIARAINSKMFLFENVKGLLSKKNDGQAGKMFEDICDEFESLNHSSGISFKLSSRDKQKVLLNAQDYGVPQARERIFLIGINTKFQVGFDYPKITHGVDKEFDYVSVGDALSCLPKIKSGEGNEILPSDYNNYISTPTPAGKKFMNTMTGKDEEFEMLPHLEFNSSVVTFQKAVNHSEKMKNRMRLINQGEGMKKAADRLIAEGKEELIKKYFPNKLYASRNRRLKIDKPSFTVTSHCLDEIIHPTEDRGITPREAARLQSFPDWYHIAGPYVKFHSDPEQDKYEQIGDAIPPLLAYALGVEVSNTLNTIEKIYQMEEVGI